MKPGIPWSVKGIGSEAREAAKSAARRSGMTLGEWLNSVILEQAEGEGPAMNQLEPQASGFPLPKKRASDAPIRLDDLAAQLNRLTQRDQDTAANKFHYQPPPPPIDKDMTAKLLARIEMNERQTLEAFSAVNERLNSLSQEITQSAAARMPQRPEDVPGYQALDNALRNIVGHIEISDKRTRDTLKTLQDRVADVGQKIAASDPERLLQNAPVIAQLDGRFGELAGRLERLEYSAQRDLPGIVEGQFAKLAERIETVRLNAESQLHRAETGAVQTTQRELQEVENRLRALITDTQSTVRLNQASAADIRRLHSDIEGLSQRIDDIKTDAASERDVYAMRQAIEQLSARIAQGPDLRPLAEMDRKLAELSVRLEQLGEGPDVSPQLYELEQRVAGLDQRLREVLDRQNDTHVYQGLEQQIAEVTQRLSATDSRLSHLAVLEQSIHQLYESIEQSRNWTQKVAEDAANRMADRLLQNQQAQRSGPSPELVALENGLAAVRTAASAADRRNQETLEAVHETLEQIVNKLTEMETTPPASWRAAIEAAIPAAPVVHAPALEPQPIQPQPVYNEPPRLDQPSFAYQERQQPIPSIADLGPVVPGQNFQDPATPLYEPVNPSAASAAPTFPGSPLGGTLEPQVLPQLSADDLQRDDFIAAARRAAQVASQQMTETVATKAAKSSSLLGKAKEALSSLRGPGKSAAKPAAQTFSTVATPAAPKVAYKTNSNHRMRLILAGLVLLASVAAYTTYQFGSSSKDAVAPASAPAPAALEAPPEVTAPATPQPGGAQPPQPRPAELENNSSLENSNLDRMSGKTNPDTIDNVLTSTLTPGKPDTTLREVLGESSGSDTALLTASLPQSIGPDSLRMAATNGDPIAQFVVASKYLDGRNVEQDLTQAAQWYRAAASKGLAPAQYRLATLFERGRGLPKDVATARVWYERAAEQGNVKAMHNAAVIYASTEAGPPEYDQAFKWFKAAAEHGLKDSQFNLAVLYERGLGADRNLGEAMFWYSLAGKQNDNDAANKASVLAQSLAPLTVSEVKTRLSSWQPKQGLAEANVVSVIDPSWQNGNSASNTMPATVPAAGNIKIAQDLLTSLGFNVGTADGRMGNKTANAIRLFQLQEGLKVTGEVTPELIEQLQIKQVQGQQS
jgi:localization factor PodJL